VIGIPVLHPYPKTAGLLSGDLGRGGMNGGYPAITGQVYSGMAGWVCFGIGGRLYSRITGRVWSGIVSLPNSPT